MKTDSRTGYWAAGQGPVLFSKVLGVLEVYSKCVRLKVSMEYPEKFLTGR